MGDRPANGPWYKVLDLDGKSCQGGTLTWSLPRQEKTGEWKPGKWHEVDGELRQCSNGLHLTNEPEQRGSAYRETLYLAEVDGETVGPFRDELVCRKVRLVRRVFWYELLPEDSRTDAQRYEEAKLNAVEAAREAKRLKDEAVKLVKHEGDSPAYTLLKYIWKHNAGGSGNDSWRRLNDSMHQALRLAITGGFEFHLDDFSRFAKEFTSSYWVGDGEAYYALACGDRSDSHGGNPTAVGAFEKWKGRKPFLVIESANSYGRRGKKVALGTRLRLHVGARFDWHIGLKKRVLVTVTSFNDNPGDGVDPYLVACSYKEPPKGSHERKIDKRFRITHEDIKSYHSAVREHHKSNTAAAT